MYFRNVQCILYYTSILCILDRTVLCILWNIGARCMLYRDSKPRTLCNTGLLYHVLSTVVWYRTMYTLLYLCITHWVFVVGSTAHVSYNTPLH